MGLVFSERGYTNDEGVPLPGNAFELICMRAHTGQPRVRAVI